MHLGESPRNPWTFCVIIAWSATWAVHDSHVISAWSVTWSVHDQSRDLCMISHGISAWSITWSVHDQSRDQCMVATWSLHDQPRDQCTIATWSLHDQSRDTCVPFLQIRWRPERKYSRAHQEKVTGWDMTSALFGFVKCLCLSLQNWITEMWRMHIQEKLQYTLRVQGRMCLIRSREARGDFLKNTKSREEENVDCSG